MTQCFLIDDDIDDQEIFCMALAHIDPAIQCTIAGDGSQALDMLETMVENIPDYIFIDMNMPKMNGIACLKAIKKMKHISSNVYMFSTTSDKQIIDMSVELGALDFIIKPAGLSELITRLRKVLNR